MKWVLLVFLYGVNLFATIVVTPHLDKFAKEVNRADENTLVLFDVDETLILPKDSILKAKRVLHTMAKPYLRESKDQYPYYRSLILSQMEFELVDPKVVELIRGLQERKIKTIALTKMLTDSFGEIPSMIHWRYDQLKELGIDFSEAFPELSHRTFKVLHSTASYYQGVVATNKLDKGPVLVAFLDEVKWRPSKVLFIDNRLDFLLSVEESLKGSGIEYIGFYYTEAENRPNRVHEKQARMQLEHLIKERVWLADSSIDMKCD